MANQSESNSSENRHHCVDINSRAYVPQLVTIGPFHFDQDRFRNYENIKLILLVHTHPHRARGILLDHETRCVTPFKQLVNEMAQDEALIDRIRQWYLRSRLRTRPSLSTRIPFIGREGERNPAEDKPLCQMLVKDGLFLLHFLRELSRPTASSFSPTTHKYDEARFFRAFLPAFAVQEDLMKLENQIPLFILEKILEWESTTFSELSGDFKDATEGTKKLILQDLILQWEAGTDQLISILRHAWHILSPFKYVGDRQDSQEPLLGDRSDSHLLGFVYQNIISSSPDTRDSPTGNRRYTMANLETAVKLKEKGVKFAALKKQYLDEILFDGLTCTFYLPPIKMDDRTDTFMRNLVDFEVERLNSRIYQSSPLMCYVNLMKQLIKAAGDVEVLRNGGIIESHLRSDEDVVKVWEKMELQAGEFQAIDDAIDGVMRFYKSIYRIFRLRVMFRIMFAAFKKKYLNLSNPWVTISLIAASILLGATLMQTVLLWKQT